MNNETPRISPARFSPTRVELVNILRKRIDRGERSSLITDNHILYETAPWLIRHVRHGTFYENEWYYFVTRKQPPAITRKPGSWRPCRKVGEAGRWKTTGLTTVVDKNGVRVGSLNYASFKTNGATQRHGKSTGWAMHEYVLDRPGFQELVLCRIRFRPGQDNAQYAPRLSPIMIGQSQQPPVETHRDPVTDQWTAFWSDEAGLPDPESSYPIWNGGMEQRQNIGSYDQQQDHILGHMGQNGQGFGDLVDNPIQYLRQETMDRLQIPMMMNQALNEEQQWNGYSGPSLAHQYLGQDMVPMTQHFAAQHQHFSVDEHHGLDSSVQIFGESSGQQQNHILGTQALMEDPSHLAPAREDEEHQEFGYSSLFLAQNNQYLRQNNDLLAPGELTAQQQLLGQDSNLSLTQQKNQIPGQATYLPPMEQQFWQTDHSLVPQQENAVRNLPAQLQLEEQDNVPLMNQAMEEQAASLPMNQGTDEQHGGIVGYL
ncbi:hypothetical protein Bca4012_019217 [Brassica carinata]